MAETLPLWQVTNGPQHSLVGAEVDVHAVEQSTETSSNRDKEYFMAKIDLAFLPRYCLPLLMLHGFAIPVETQFCHS